MTNNLVQFVEKIPNVYVNINKLIYEFETIKNEVHDVNDHGNQVLVQRKFHIMIENCYNEDIPDLPYTKEISEKLSAVLKYNSINYRFVMPNTCYNWHQDTGLYCLHIPLVTNIGCKFVYENRCFSMPADGSVYIVNNGKMHTFINAGPTARLHLTYETL